MNCVFSWSIFFLKKSAFSANAEIDMVCFWDLVTFLCNAAVKLSISTLLKMNYVTSSTDVCFQHGSHCENEFSIKCGLHNNITSYTSVYNNMVSIY